MSIRVSAWHPDSPCSRNQLEAVLALHRANKATLGPMPDAAFRERAKHGGLLIGVLDENVLAYALYDIPRHNLVKLVHVCVDEAARGTGVARALVDEAVRLHPRRSYITAACRTDYGIDGFWRSLGMHISSEKPGRALSGSTLANWVKRINFESGLDLLEMVSIGSGLPVAILDTNVVEDLFSPETERRDHRKESSELAADWLQPLVSFAVSGEVDNEISAIEDVDARRRLREATSHLTRLSTRRPGDLTIEDALLRATDPSLLVKDPSLRNDVLQVADAVNASADYFVTNDSNVCKSAALWKQSLGETQVVRPHQLVRALSPVAFMSDFRSSLIDGSDLEWHPVGEVDDALEAMFRVYDLETKPADFHRLVRGLLARPGRVQLEKLTDSDGRLWALAGHEMAGKTLRLHLLRAIRGERGATVTFQLLRHFRRVAWQAGATTLEVTDTAISPTVHAALQADGFSGSSVREARLGPRTVSAVTLGNVTPSEVIIAERQRWPMMVRGAGLPTYLIPIRPAWASRLLGLNDGLYSDRRRGLGLSRELVYFSGTRITPKQLPARVLWYASSDKTIQLSQVVAHSVMLDSTRVPAIEAVERFASLGVLRKSEILAAADRSGQVSVIRFQDTELLVERVSFRDPLFKSYVKGEVRSMRSVAPAFFDAILEAQLTRMTKA